MSKKATKKDKELRKLRRENEFLKARLSSHKSTVTAPVKKKKQVKRKMYQSRVTALQLRKDLTRAGVISGICLAVIGVCYFVL